MNKENCALKLVDEVILCKNLFMTYNKVVYFTLRQLQHISFFASQAKSINLFKNLKTKVMKCCANIDFYRHYLTKKVIPNYSTINNVIEY